MAAVAGAIEMFTATLRFSSGEGLVGFTAARSPVSGNADASAVGQTLDPGEE